MFRTTGAAAMRTSMCVVAAVIVVALCGCNPEITSFTPTSGQPGDPVTVYGHRFKTDATKDTLWFGATLAQIIGSPTETVIQTKVPAGASTGFLTIKTTDGKGTSQTNFSVITPKKWTFLVYLDADNNLESDGLDDFLEMASVGTTPAINIVVQMDRRPGYSAAYGDWTDTRRFLIQKNDTPASTAVELVGEKNMGDPAVLQDFVTWGVTHYPAEHYMLVLWNHGGGWKEMQEKIATMRTGTARGATGEAMFKEVSYDDTNADFLYMKEVQQALTSAKDMITPRLATFVKLDVVGFDACLMGMVEVAYALRDCGNLMIGSEELEPAAGWPYNTILSELAAHPTMSPRDLCVQVVSKYVASYSASANVTLAAQDLSQIVPLAGAIDAFTDGARSEWDKLKSARQSAHQYHVQGWNTLWGTDLRGFAQNVANSVAGVPLKTLGVALIDAVTKCVIAEGHGQSAAGSNGLAIYFPPTKAAFDNDPDHGAYTQGNQFMTVDFVQQHVWDEWLLIYYQNIAGLP